MELTEENYHSVEARKEYMGASQFKDFHECELRALKRVNGELEDKTTDALTFGTCVDDYFSFGYKDINELIKNHPEICNSRTGELKAAFKNIEDVINTFKNDEMLFKYLQGEHQVIMTGVIAGVKFKIKIDSYFPDKAMVDQKVMKDLNPVWIEKIDENGYTHNEKVNFVEAYGYDIIAAIYQEVERQFVGKERKLPYILDIATKEDVPDKALVKIDQKDIDKALELVKELAPRYAAIKRGEIPPVGCGKCQSCRQSKKIKGIKSYHIFDPYKEEEY